MVFLEAQRTFLINNMRELRWTVKNVSEVSKDEAVRCAYCMTDVILHNDGKEMPPHVEHKNRQNAKEANCPTFENGFNEEKYLASKKVA